jgi:hypothetical protein
MYSKQKYLGLVILFPIQAAASSCLLSVADAEALTGRPGFFERLSIGKVAVTPCQGIVSRGDAEVLFSRNPGVTHVALVKKGRELREEIPQPLRNLAAPGGIVGALWSSLSSPRAMRPGSRRFDGAEGLVLGGEVLAGRELRIPLQFFGWDSSVPVSLRGSGLTQTFRIDAGTLVLPAGSLQLGSFELMQGSRVAPFKVVAEATLDALGSQLKEIADTSSDESTRLLRETLLFWEYGLVMNAVDSDARREKISR